MTEEIYKDGQSITVRIRVPLIVNPEPNFKSTEETRRELEKVTYNPPGVPLKIAESKVIRDSRWYRTNKGWINSLALVGQPVNIL